MNEDLKLASMELTYQGRTFELETLGGDDLLTHRLASLGTFYELDLLEYMRTMRRWMDGDTAIDAGGNIGNHSLFFVSYLFPNVISVEPHESLFELVQKNLAHTSVRCVQMALGEAQGQGYLIHGRKENLGEAQAVMGDGDIRFTTFDAMASCRRIGMDKIDVEGGEMGVLRGAREVLRKHRPH
jgi:FkbM family methyltransferase